MIVLIIVVVIVIVVLLALVLWVAYNGLVRRRNRTQEAWSEIDVELKRRHDLIPNLSRPSRVMRPTSKEPSRR